MPAYKTIHSAKAPQPIGCYSQGTQVGHFVFLSGQIGLDPATSELVPGFEGQLRQVLNNMREVINASGGDFSNIVKLTIYLLDLNDFSQVNALMKEQFIEPYPARTTIQVAGLPKEALVEIEAIIAL